MDGPSLAGSHGVQVEDFGRSADLKRGEERFVDDPGLFHGGEPGHAEGDPGFLPIAAGRDQVEQIYSKASNTRPPLPANRSPWDGFDCQGGRSDGFPWVSKSQARSSQPKSACHWASKVSGGTAGWKAGTVPAGERDFERVGSLRRKSTDPCWNGNVAWTWAGLLPRGRAEILGRGSSLVLVFLRRGGRGRSFRGPRRRSSNVGRDDSPVPGPSPRISVAGNP
jgi:hypothetical protein